MLQSKYKEKIKGEIAAHPSEGAKKKFSNGKRKMPIMNSVFNYTNSIIITWVLMSEFYHSMIYNSFIPKK